MYTVKQTCTEIRRDRKEIEERQKEIVNFLRKQREGEK